MVYYLFPLLSYTCVYCKANSGGWQEIVAAVCFWLTWDLWSFSPGDNTCVKRGIQAWIFCIYCWGLLISLFDFVPFPPVSYQSEDFQASCSETFFVFLSVDLVISGRLAKERGLVQKKISAHWLELQSYI